MAETSEPRNYALSEMRIERGDVLLSLELALTRESYREGDRGVTEPPPTPRRFQEWLPPKWEPQPLVALASAPPAAEAGPVAVSPVEKPERAEIRVSVPRPAPTAEPVRVGSGVPMAASIIRDLSGPGVPPDLGLIDPASGAGSINALRRDVDLAMIWASQGEPGFGLLAIDVQPLSDIRSAFGAGVADHVLRTIVEGVPFVLRSKDRLYRTGGDKLVLFLADTMGEKAMITGKRLEEHAQASLAARRLPEVCLSIRPLDPAVVGGPVHGDGYGAAPANRWDFTVGQMVG